MENEYQKMVEQFRLHYKERFNIQMDDDILYLIIRINELHKDLKKDIANIPEVRFRNGWDYFLYGLGKYFCWACIVLFTSMAIILFVH